MYVCIYRRKYTILLEAEQTRSSHFHSSLHPLDVEKNFYHCRGFSSAHGHCDTNDAEDFIFFVDILKNKLEQFLRLFYVMNNKIKLFTKTIIKIINVKEWSFLYILYTIYQKNCHLFWHSGFLLGIVKIIIYQSVIASFSFLCRILKNTNCTDLIKNNKR